MSSQRRTRVVLGLFAVVAAAAAIDGAHTWRQHMWNEAIVSGPLPADDKDVPVQVRFAQAHARADSGADDAALRLYRSLEDDSPLGQAARYNSANLLMRQAVVVQAGAEPGKAIALIELAKEIYRDVLRVDPQYWDARYNLERAQRLLPDPDEMDVAPPETRRDAERAATTMRGYSPGLP
ncbi:MxaK protein [Variovorax sp. J22R115]|uniref:MxaK protein n=1 Tax=Variovorax sp. J22R115 TaxID=3053509 RepID=UPI0025775F85|nr:MxaK protein [Variovorax sp. J22R115]MDM0049498.1 MxaK protein [Variovorax sp. J22R115]